MTRYIREHWSQSRAFRIALILAVIYAGLRLLVHVGYLSVLLAPEGAMLEGLPGWAETEGPMLPVDLQVYLDAAERFERQEDLYMHGAVTRLEDLYQYTPAFAMFSRAFLRMPPASVAAIHTLLHLIAYVVLYALWDRVFRQSALPEARRTLACVLPLWLVFPDFWSDLGYLNIYIFMALLSTLLIESILAERVVWSALWLSLILQTKPQWAAVAAVPALLGRWRFTLKTAGLALSMVAASAGLAVLASNPTYAFEQYAGYARFLTQLSGHFPWRLPTDGFLGYNHSMKQIVFFLFGAAPGAARFVKVAKALLLAPLGMIGVKCFTTRVRTQGRDAPELSLNLAFALYLAAFVWLDMVWELTLGIAVFVYLVASADGDGQRRLLWITFLPYALVDVLRLAGAVLAFVGLNTVVPGPYVLTDPSVHVPMVMILILVFYGVLLETAVAGAVDPKRDKGDIVDPQTFLELSPGEVAAIVRAEGPKVCVFPINGTRRWFKLEYPELAAEGMTTSYLRISGQKHIELYRLFFDHGIETLLTPVFGPDILRRDEGYRELLEDGLAWFATNDDFLEFYREYDVRVRVYGDVARYFENTGYEQVLETYRELEARTGSHRSRRLLYGVCAQDASESVAEIAIEFHRRRGRPPTREEIVEAYYGEYVDPVDLFIGFDRPAAFDMPLLALGTEALYFTVCPSLYVDARTLKSILYDHVYARRVDDRNYSRLSAEDWDAMRQFYTANRHRVIGLGRKHPSGDFWYPTPQVSLPSSISRRLRWKKGGDD